MGKKDTNEAALAQMERKYGEKFTYEGPYGNSMSGTRQLLASCASLDGLVLVEVENFRKGPVVYRDNYLAVRYREETEVFFCQCVEEEFGKAKISYEPRRRALPEDLPANASFEQYLAEGGVPLSVVIGVKESRYTSDEQLQRVAERAAESGAQFRMTLLLLEDASFAVADAAGLEKALKDGDFVRCAKVEVLDADFRVRWLEE